MQALSHMLAWRPHCGSPLHKAVWGPLVHAAGFSQNKQSKKGKKEETTLPFVSWSQKCDTIMISPLITHKPPNTAHIKWNGSPLEGRHVQGFENGFQNHCRVYDLDVFSFFLATYQLTNMPSWGCSYRREDFHPGPWQPGHSTSLCFGVWALREFFTDLGVVEEVVSCGEILALTPNPVIPGSCLFSESS